MPRIEGEVHLPGVRSRSNDRGAGADQGQPSGAMGPLACGHKRWVVYPTTACVSNCLSPWATTRVQNQRVGNCNGDVFVKGYGNSHWLRPGLHHRSEAELQVDALKAAGCLVFTDKASGSLTSLPQLDRMLDHLREGDVVVVWRLDRLGRSLKQLIALVEGLADRGVGFRSLSESVDTTSANGKLVLLDHGGTGRVRARPDPGAHQPWISRSTGQGAGWRSAGQDDSGEGQGGQGYLQLEGVHGRVHCRQYHRGIEKDGVPALGTECLTSRYPNVGCSLQVPSV